MKHATWPHYSRQVFFDPREQEHVALCFGFPYLSGFGAAATEALAELDVALEGPRRHCCPPVEP